MSPSTKSKPASESSLATGAASKDLEAVAIELEVSRQRWIAWALGGIVGGILLVLKLGTVGVWGGFVLIAIGLFRAAQLVMSFVHPAGSIVVGPKQIQLPRGAYRGTPLSVEPSTVKAVYFLRRSVPWNRSAPVLVIEVGDKAMPFPRDWFASEADQRRVVHALLTHLPAVRREAETKVAAEPAAATES